MTLVIKDGMVLDEVNKGVEFFTLELIFRDGSMGQPILLLFLGSRFIFLLGVRARMLVFLFLHSFRCRLQLLSDRGSSGRSGVPLLRHDGRQAGRQRRLEDQAGRQELIDKCCECALFIPLC